MDGAMTLSVIDVVISELTTLYSDQPTFNADKLSVIVSNVVEEVIRARNYKNVGYSDDKIMADLFKYKSNIKRLAEYDFATFGATHQTSHSENSVNRSWIDRNKLFAGIVAISPLGD